MVGETTTRRLAAYQNQAEIMLQNHHGSQGLCGSNDTPKSQSVGFADSQNVLVNAKIGQNKWTKGTMAALRIPSDTNLKALGKSLLILFVLVGLLAVAVNYAKAKFF